MIRVGINACRARSGGAVAHLAGLVGALDPEVHGFHEIHVWSYDRLLQSLPERPWLIKRSTGRWQASLARELVWERFCLKRLARQSAIDIIFNVDVGTVCRFRPSIMMSQDMLSYEPGEMDRYAYGKAWARLLALRYVQNASLRRGDGAIFLTDYAAETIQRACGKLANVTIVPHGVDRRFRDVERTAAWPAPGARALRCLYVSNTAPYKHQWHVVDAIARLRNRGWVVELNLVGGGRGPAQSRLLAQIARSDPDGRFVTRTDFVPHADIPRLLADADLFVFASSCENMPITLLEAMAVGLPIACSNRGPMPKVLQNGGAYFDPEDPESIAAALESLLQTPDKRTAYARRARALAGNYSWKRCAAQTFDFIHHTLQRSHGKPATT
jgi:glycosyltransferase involved in cell wall biosynthesis